jgi:hypothetical protein
MLATFRCGCSPDTRPLLLAGMVNGVDRLVTQSALNEEFQPVYEAYRKMSSAKGPLTIQSGKRLLILLNGFSGTIANRTDTEVRA